MKPKIETLFMLGGGGYSEYHRLMSNSLAIEKKVIEVFIAYCSSGYQPDNPIPLCVWLGGRTAGLYLMQKRLRLKKEVVATFNRPHHLIHIQFKH